MTSNAATGPTNWILRASAKPRLEIPCLFAAPIPTLRGHYCRPQRWSVGTLPSLEFPHHLHSYAELETTHATMLSRDNIDVDDDDDGRVERVLRAETSSVHFVERRTRHRGFSFLYIFVWFTFTLRTYGMAYAIFGSFVLCRICSN